MRFSIQSLLGCHTRSINNSAGQQRVPSHDANSQVHLEELALVPTRADFNTSLCHLEQLVEDVGPLFGLDLQSRKLDPSREDRGAEFLQPFFDVRAVPSEPRGRTSALLLRVRERKGPPQGAKDSPSEAQLVRANLIRRPGIARPRNLEQLLDDVASPARARDEFGFEGGKVLSGGADERSA